MKVIYSPQVRAMQRRHRWNMVKHFAVSFTAGAAFVAVIVVWVKV